MVYATGKGSHRAVRLRQTRQRRKHKKRGAAMLLAEYTDTFSEQERYLNFAS